MTKPGSMISPSRSRPPHILLRSAWQTVNIGDIAHTPGMLRLLEREWPEARTTLWASHVGDGVRELLADRFPRVQVVQGRLDAEDASPSLELAAAVADADVLLHSSGPSLVAHRDVRAWQRQTGKPWGAVGVTIEQIDAPLAELLQTAAFLFLRDSVSVEHVRLALPGARTIEFCPDAAFACDLADTARAQAFLQANGLRRGEFACFIPRLRYTPYFQVHGYEPRERERQLHEISLRHRSADHAKLRHAIVCFVRETHSRALVCPEMTYQVGLGKEELVDPLPDDVRRQVVWRDRFWLPDEAAAVYGQALAVVSCEMHSPILAAAAGTPAILVRQPTDTCKGRMWKDIGLERWSFEIDEATGDSIADALLSIAAAPDEARSTVSDVMAKVVNLQSEAVELIKRTIL